jgi:hypothetical protein
MKNVIPLLGLLIITGCQTGPYPVSSPYYTIPAGSQLRIKQNLTIPANSATVYLQNGAPVARNKLDQYYPHCWFESWQRLKNSQTIKPDTFTINAVKIREEVVMGQSKFLLASTALSGSIGVGGGSATAVEYITELTIKSDTQPDIRKLFCNHWEDPVDGRHLTVPEMNKALGGYAELLPKTG